MDLFLEPNLTIAPIEMEFQTTILKNLLGNNPNSENPMKISIDFQIYIKSNI